MHLQAINTLQKGTCDGGDTIKYLTTMCDEILPASADGNQCLKGTKALLSKLSVSAFSILQRQKHVTSVAHFWTRMYYVCI